MTARIDLCVATDHPSFAGHFPGRPIVPGALLIDLAVMAVEHATGRTVACIAQAKFLSPATPGETLSLLFEANENTIRFDIEANGTKNNTETKAGRKLASGRFTLSAHFAQIPA